MSKKKSPIVELAPPRVLKALAKRRKWKEQRGKEFRITKPRLRDPRQVERAAIKEYRKRLERLFELVETQLIANLPTLLATDDFEKPQLATPKRDALGEDIAVIINGIKVQFLRELRDSELRAAAQKFGLEVAEHNLSELNRVLKTVVDLDIFQDEPFLRTQLENYVEQNVSLIKSVDERYFTDVQNEVFSGARQGLSTKDISARIRDKGRVAKNRADLIARDQVASFNGQLSKLRQTNLGVGRYVWRSSLDERVRPEHREREGKIFSWDDPPFDGHPGEPINCRCYAEPIIEDLIEDL